ncbi:AMP-binding protein [Actinocrinis puniceicyclus]|uniref:AMP-binding protein n=1 Tax=Actinocrinis puniceicyclus TaxID=977794 RepID=A0A8J7WRC3_9ACTN|nr:AMP-binding protein [Actinocrinis puniceicyclus]MBS2965022.1 AMP-binding protein [Actinocrinis puniceicyclus]
MHIPDRTLLDWLAEPAAGRGLHYADSGDSWTAHPYRDLAQLTLRCAAALGERGVRRGDVVAVMQRSSPGFVAGLFGALAAGATACSMAPPFAFQRTDEYERHISHLLDTARPALIVVDDDAAEHVRGPAARLGLRAPVRFEELIDGISPLTEPRQPAETALLQFTSGSSGYSRGVRISAQALQANVTAMRRWLQWPAEYPGTSWLPVHHDMGLIGCLVNIVVTECDGYMMQPDDFIRSPLRYLKCISDNSVRMAAMPNFGLAYILRRVRPGQLDGLRFESLRGVILGAERIDPRVLDGFERLLGPHGFDRRALLPAYGGAEATLAVTGLPLAEGWTVATPRQGSDAPAEPLGVVGCGRPLEGMSVDIVGEDGEPLEDGQVGEITVRGACVATQYVGDPGSSSGTRLGDGVLRTGDAGFLRDGQLFVLGRLGDGLKVRGRMLFAESLEAELCERGVPERRATVLLGVRDGAPTAAVVFELPRPEWIGTTLDLLTERLEDADLLAVLVPRGGLAVTSSGKPRRRVMWQALCAGTLEGRIAPMADALREAEAAARAELQPAAAR